MKEHLGGGPLLTLILHMCRALSCYCTSPKHLLFQFCAALHIIACLLNATCSGIPGSLSLFLSRRTSSICSLGSYAVSSFR